METAVREVRCSPFERSQRYSKFLRLGCTNVREEIIWDTSIWIRTRCHRLRIRSAQSCYLCDRYVVLPMSPDCTRKKWSREWELNPRPVDYESTALPLSYLGP